MANDSLLSNNLTPGVLSLLPIFYVGWSDSVLSPSEMKLIHQLIGQSDFLSKEDKAYLIRWSDPMSPPPEAIFKAWVASIKKYAASLSEQDKSSLATIGLQMARSAIGHKKNELWNAPKTRDAILAISDALGVHNEHSLNLVKHLIEDYRAEPTNLEYSFSPKRLQSFLDGKQKTTKDRMRKLLRDPFFAYQTIPDKDAFRASVLKQLKALADQGLGAYAFPKKYGGGERKGEHITVFEMLAYHDLSLTIKFGVQFGLFGGAVYGLGTERHHEKYLEALGNADLLGCFAMTETGHGSNVRGLQTTATYNHDDRTIEIHTPEINDAKEYIGNALHCHMAAVFAQLIVDGKNHGVHAILVPMRDTDGVLLPGIRVEDCGYKMGLNGVDNGKIWYDHVKVPVENLLNRYGDIDANGNYQSAIDNPNKRFFTMLGALVAGRVCVGMAGANVSKTGLAIAIKYALNRRQFSAKEGAPETLLMDYPTHQRRLIPLLAKTYAYSFALGELADRYVNAEENEIRQVETDAAGLKSVATWHATQTLQECREACGGKGYLWENRIPALKADADIFTTFEGDNTVLMQLVAKGLLTNFKQTFHDEGFRAVIKYVRSRIANTATAYNPVYRRMTSINHLLDRDFHRHAFNFRQEKLLFTLSGRMQDYLKKRMAPADAFLKVQNHTIELAKAYVHNLTLKSFVSSIERCETPKEQNILSRLCDLYALTIIEEEKGWFLETDYMDGSKTKAIRRLITKLCQDLRPDIEGLIDAFGIPEELLGAEIVVGS